MSKVTEKVIDSDKLKLRLDIERAKKIQVRLLKERKDAPNGVVVGDVFIDPLDAAAKRLITGFKPTPLAHGKKRGKDEPYNKGATKSAGWNIKQKKDKMISEGWIPVVEDGEHYSHGDLYLYERDIKLRRDSVKRAARAGSKMFDDTSKQMRDAEKSGGGKILSDEMTVTKGEIQN